MMDDYLSVEEELGLIKQMRTEETGREALKRLVLNYESMVHKIARKYHSNDPALEYDDIVQAGFIGLIKALKKYDPSTRNRVSTYVYVAISRDIQKIVARSGTVKRGTNPDWTPKGAWARRMDEIRRMPVVSLDLVDSDDDTPAGDRLIGDDDVEEGVLERVLIEQILTMAKVLPAWQRVMWHIAEGYSVREAAELEGLSKGIFSAALYKIRRHPRSRAVLGEVAEIMGFTFNYD